VILTEGKRILLDFKTIRSYPFKLTKEGKKDLDRTYLYQMTIYIYLLRKQGYNIDSGIFIFENKDDQEYFGLKVNYDESLLKEILLRINQVKVALNSKIVPSREYELGKAWQCNYCSYKHKCHEGV
jgi:CRISPR/Cas system-associated exonuclease Cas4 (RecB family)